MIILDGSSVLATSFYGSVPREYYFAKTEADREKVLPRLMQTPDGVYTNGVFTMTKKILDIIKKQKPTHMAVAWDITRNTFRKQCYDGYKATREAVQPELLSQFDLMQELLAAAGIPTFAHPEYEADDIIGTLARRFEREIPTYVLTKDRDALQVVSDYTRLWLMCDDAGDRYKKLCREMEIEQLDLPEKVFEYTPQLVAQDYGVYPQQIPDLKGLCGDKSDNIPGVKGVGEKSVVPLLQEFGTLEYLYEAVENSDADDLKALFKDLGIARSPLACLLKQPDGAGELCGKAAAYLSKRLATIVTDIPEFAGKSLPELELKLNPDGLTAMIEGLGFKSLTNWREKLLA